MFTLAHLNFPVRQRQSLSLQRTSSGWTRLDDRDQAVFEAEGRDARRRCLAHASALGVLHLTFGEQLAPPALPRLDNARTTSEKSSAVA